jgi:hypothetical protein
MLRWHQSSLSRYTYCAPHNKVLDTTRWGVRLTTESRLTCFPARQCRRMIFPVACSMILSSRLLQYHIKPSRHQGPGIRAADISAQLAEDQQQHRARRSTAAHKGRSNKYTFPHDRSHHADSAPTRVCLQRTHTTCTLPKSSGSNISTPTTVRHTVRPAQVHSQCPLRRPMWVLCCSAAKQAAARPIAPVEAVQSARVQPHLSRSGLQACARPRHPRALMPARVHGSVSAAWRMRLRRPTRLRLLVPRYCAGACGTGAAWLGVRIIRHVSLVVPFSFSCNLLRRDEAICVG